MTPVFPVPIKLPDFICSKRCESLVGTYCLNHRLLYLAMTLISFLPESDTKPSKPGPPHKLSIKEKRNENRVTN